MKIRIYGNSVRIRLSRPEVDDFCKNGFLQDKTEFGASTFGYSLQRVNEADNLSAGYENSTITVYVPAALIDGWDNNETIGFSNKQDVGDGRLLSLLLEKDFKCIDNTGMENQDDKFDNPLHACA